MRWLRDTRRRNAAGKLIGDHHGTTYYGPGGWYYKRLHNRAQRRLARAEIEAQLEERELRVRKAVWGAVSEIDWRGS